MGNEKTASTRERLREAACKVFSEKGFRDATVAEICEKAEANIAAVNYHFGDKEKLYDEVWRYAFSITAAAFPLDKNVPENPTVENTLFCYANAILHRIFSEDETGIFAKLLYHEMAAPTLALDQIAKTALLPQNEYLEKIIKQFFGDKITEYQLCICKHSIIGQCAFFNFSRALRECVLSKKGMTEEEMTITAHHIARFSLGGLKEVLS